jgi:hypothetical protein
MLREPGLNVEGRRESGERSPPIPFAAGRENARARRYAGVENRLARPGGHPDPVLQHAATSYGIVRKVRSFICQLSPLSGRRFADFPPHTLKK